MPGSPGEKDFRVNNGSISVVTFGRQFISHPFYLIDFKDCVQRWQVSTLGALSRGVIQVSLDIMPTAAVILPETLSAPYVCWMSLY